MSDESQENNIYVRSPEHVKVCFTEFDPNILVVGRGWIDNNSDVRINAMGFFDLMSNEVTPKNEKINFEYGEPDNMSV